MMEPELSVIVPVLDEVKYLEATLASIVDQNTNKPYELIVSDNGSTDGSIKIAQQYADKVVRCEERGIGPARHFGALNAGENSKYFVFIDADTHIPGYYLSFLYEMFRANQDIVAFSTGFEFSERSDQIKLAEGVANNYFLMRDRLRSATLPGFNTAVRREAYFKCGGYTNVLLEDVDFSRRITKLGTVKFYRHIKVMNSSRRLEVMGLLGTLYYYAQLDLGWELNSSLIDKISKKLGIADLREYIGIRK
jgi:glycosyltransferase involved in cell wall biosynthesis